MNPIVMSPANRHPCRLVEKVSAEPSLDVMNISRKRDRDFYIFKGLFDASRAERALLKKPFSLRRINPVIDLALR